MVRVLIAFVLVASTAAAAGAQSEAPAQRDSEQAAAGLVLTPVLNFRNAGFDSNVFRSQSARGDWTATFGPELAAAWRLGRARFAAKGALDVVYFQQFDT